MTTETTSPTRTPGQQLDDTIAGVKQQYDELNVKMHLAGMEARQEWEGMQDRWQRFCDDCQRVKAAADESGEKIDTSLGLVAEEFQSAFHRISQAIKP